jgi:hypothetical protein
MFSFFKIAQQARTQQEVSFIFQSILRRKVEYHCIVSRFTESFIDYSVSHESSHIRWTLCLYLIDSLQSKLLCHTPVKQVNERNYQRLQAQKLRNSNHIHDTAKSLSFKAANCQAPRS